MSLKRKYDKAEGVLALECPLEDTASAPSSSSGKSKVLFTTSGFQYFDLEGIGKVGVSVNIIHLPSRKEE